MKKNNILLSVVAIMVVTITSCTMTKRHYAPGYHVEWKNLRTHTAAPSLQKDKFASTAEVNVPALFANEWLEKDMPSVTASTKETASHSKSAATEIFKSESPKRKLVKIDSQIKQVMNHFGDQSYEANIHSSKGPNGLSWLIWVAAILFIPVFGGPLFILVWTAKNNGQPEWKPILLSLLCYLLCWIPGVIYDIIWIKKNCSGSLF
jgi:hypothetical protein